MNYYNNLKIFLFLIFCSCYSLSAQNFIDVNSIDDTDDGLCDAIHCSLREAINEANNDGMMSIIQFFIFDDTIKPQNPLPVLLDNDTRIDAIESNLVLDGTNTIENGLIINGDGIIIQGLTIINFFENGLLLHNTNETLIGGEELAQGTKINNNKTGILFSGNSSGNIIINNQISDNEQWGIETTDNSHSNLISENSIFCNLFGGILTPDDIHPIIPTITYANSLEIGGMAAPDYLVELFINIPENCPSDNYCQGKTYIGNTLSNGDGLWTFDLFGTYVSAGDLVVATATNDDNITFSFSNCLVIADSCNSALELPVYEAPCVGSPFEVDLTYAHPSLATNMPMNPCAGNYDVKDLWFKVVVPQSGNLLIRHHSPDTIQTLIEVLTGGECGGLTSYLCDTLYQEANLLFITGLIPEEIIHLRIWDEGNDDIGRIQLSVHELPADLNQAVICDGSSTSGGRKPNEFIVKYKNTATIGEIDAVRNELMLFGDVHLEKSCDCSNPPIDLWRVDNPINLEDRAKATKRKPAVDTVNYNFIIIKDDPLIGSGKAVDEPTFIAPYSEQDIVKVAIIDSGIESNHSSFQNALWTTATDNCVGEDLLGLGYDFKNGHVDPEDIDGHGTAVNGIVVLGIPGDIKLEMINGKFYQDDKGDLFDAVCAIHYAVVQEAEIINLSWGFKNGHLPEILEEALLEAESQDILMTSSAGNTHENNDEIDKWPANANMMNLITVAAMKIDSITDDTCLAPFSNYGLNRVHLAAMGYAETTVKIDSIDKRAGTSIAAPYVAKTAAIIRARYPSLNYMDVKDCILSSVKRVDVLLDSVETGGVLDELAALACANDKAGICTDQLELNHVEENTRNYQVSDKITSTSIIESSGDINYRAENNICFNPGFHAKPGSQMSAQINTCSQTLNDVASENRETILPETPENQMVEPLSLMTIYPNPVKNTLNLTFNFPSEEANFMTLLDLNGRVLKTWKMPPNNLDIQQFSFDVGDLNSGLYFIQLKSPGQMVTGKIVIKQN